jgi:hypothetical protein
MKSRDLRIATAVVAAFCMSIAGADEALVASTFSKAAIYVMSTDFIHDPVERFFSAEELSVLEQYQTELNAIIQNVSGHSVGGALFAVYFRLEENIPSLRYRLFRPGTVYGWEGPDYDSEEDYLADNQFVYHSVYLTAIEEITGRPVYEAIQPTQLEINELFRILQNPASENYYWAKWLARKLLLLESPG